MLTLSHRCQLRLKMQVQIRNTAVPVNAKRLSGSGWFISWVSAQAFFSIVWIVSIDYSFMAALILNTTNCWTRFKNINLLTELWHCTNMFNKASVSRWATISFRVKRCVPADLTVIYFGINAPELQQLSCSLSLLLCFCIHRQHKPVKLWSAVVIIMSYSASCNVFKQMNYYGVLYFCQRTQDILWHSNSQAGCTDHTWAWQDCLLQHKVLTARCCRIECCTMHINFLWLLHCVYEKLVSLWWT